MKRSLGRFITIAFFALLFSASIKAEIFTAYLTGAQEVPAVATNATGYAIVNVNESAGTLTFIVVFNNLSSNQTASHIHAPAAIGATAAVAINFGAVGGTSGTITGSASITPTQLAQLRAHQGYVNVHSANNGGGEIRGQLGIQRPVDYDGDGRQDYSVLRFPNVAPPGVAQIQYWNLNSTSGIQNPTFGDANTDFPTPGDYDGDGKGDIALYRDGTLAAPQSTFYILRSSDSTFQFISFGVDGDQAVARDFDGDGKTDPAIFRRGTVIGQQSFWWIRESTTGGDRVIPFGTTGDTTTGSSGDTPVPGDYDGDGKFDPAIYRFGGLTPNNTFIILQSSNGTVRYQQWGNFQTDYILPGDYDGDGKTDFCAGRTGATSTSPMVWWILQSSNGQNRVQTFGISSDLPVQGDYDGDARTDIAIYRRGATATDNSTFWVFNSLSGTATAQIWGLRADFPVANFDAR